MPDTVLIAYASKYGSTKEVAEQVAATLRERGLTVEVMPAADVDDLGLYRAIVLGAPFYIGKLLKDATAFLERHRAALQEKPVALFTLGPVSASEDMAEARQQLDNFLEKLGWLKPAAAEMFVGKFDPDALRGLDKLVTKPKASPLHDLGMRDDRDWDAIRSWAESLPEALD